MLWELLVILRNVDVERLDIVVKPALDNIATAGDQDHVHGAVKICDRVVVGIPGARA